MIKKIFFIQIVLLILTVSFIVFYEKYYLIRYSKTEINVPFESLIQNWGNPDLVLNDKYGGKTVFYYSILNEFVFNVDEKDKVTLKYKDNF